MCVFFQHGRISSKHDLKVLCVKVIKFSKTIARLRAVESSFISCSKQSDVCPKLRVVSCELNNCNSQVSSTQASLQKRFHSFRETYIQERSCLRRVARPTQSLQLNSTVFSNRITLNVIVDRLRYLVSIAITYLLDI